jgi:nucleoside-diphosphate-sugar epimerase
VVLLTRGAVTATAEDDTDPAAAAIWGLVRSAQSENPGRITLIDLDDQAAAAAVPAVNIAAYPQAAVRAGQLFTPRLVPAPRDSGETPDGTDPALAGTVLVTGGTGVLGALTARHLAGRGAMALLLASRRGPAAAGTAALAADLARAGAAVTVTACDIAQPAAVQAMLAAIPAAAPLTAIYHTAGTVADATIPALTHAHLDEVMRPKADAAWNLHQATAGMGVQRFVLFSSVAGVLGSPGQGNYAAANTFLDALAGYRRARGLPGTSLAWGYWAEASGISGHLSAVDRARLNRGMAPIENDQGMALLDAAAASSRALLVPVAFNLPALREAALAGGLPPMLAGLVPAAPRQAATAGTAASLVNELALLSAEERQQRLADLVRNNVATALAYPDPNAVDLGAAFTDLGFDSLTAVDLRNRLAAATGLRLPATLIFDNPTPNALVGYLEKELAPDGTAVSRPVLNELEKLESMLSATAAESMDTAKITLRLEAILTQWKGIQERADGISAARQLESSSDDEVFDFIVNELGID